MNTKLLTPFLPVGGNVKEGLKILNSFSKEIDIEKDGEVTNYRIEGDDFDLALYVNDSKIIAVWYNDPMGRESEEGMKRKLDLYMERYGKREDWELILNNGWMEFYYNDVEKLQIVYGLHQDVIRVNLMSN
ncbi:conserved protein of unknown function [Tenacibaculum sp. 190524A02b]|uniref:hypothetical protein n=1 Tax=Tenacibaculum vairaonense TaxID=3137860 RepID=UPI0032B30C79